MNKLLYVFFLPVTLLGQGFYPFKYQITIDSIPSQCVISYMEKDTNVASFTQEKIKLVVVDTQYTTNFHSFTIKSADSIFLVSVDESECAEFKYYSDFNISFRMMGPKISFNIKDTGTTHCISQITIIVGRNHFQRHYIYSKIPLTKKRIYEIRKYVFNKGSVPLCVKKKRCWISAPEI